MVIAIARRRHTRAARHGPPPRQKSRSTSHTIATTACHVRGSVARIAANSQAYESECAWHVTLIGSGGPAVSPAFLSYHEAILPWSRSSLHFPVSVVSQVPGGGSASWGFGGQLASCREHVLDHFHHDRCHVGACSFTWVFCEYTIEAVRVLRVLAEEDEQQNQQTGSTIARRLPLLHGHSDAGSFPQQYQCLEFRVRGDGLDVVRVGHSRVHVVGDDQAAGPHQGQQFVEIVDVAFLVGVQEQHVDRVLVLFDGLVGVAHG